MAYVKDLVRWIIQKDWRVSDKHTNSPFCIIWDRNLEYGRLDPIPSKELILKSYDVPNYCPHIDTENIRPKNGSVIDK